MKGKALASLFEMVGRRLGLTIQVEVTDGSRPIGNGVGPALEVRDIYRVLENDDAASHALRDKAFGFTGSILE